MNNSNLENSTITEDSKLARLPKNIRQVGQPASEERIYIEDYVITFIRQISDLSDVCKKIFIMVGYREKIGETDCVFVNGLLSIDCDYLQLSGTFPDKVKEEINSKKSIYFDNLSIVGWGIINGDYTNTNEYISIIHTDDYLGKNALFMVYDCYEKEEIIYKYCENRLLREKGFYIYYERNENMQNYMMDERGTKSIEQGYSDDTTARIRAVANRVRNAEVENKGVEKSSSRDYEQGKRYAGNHRVGSKTRQMNRRKRSNTRGQKIRYAVTMTGLVLFLAFGAGKMDKLKETTTAKAKLAMSKAEEFSKEYDGDKDDLTKSFLDVETINGSIDKKNVGASEATSEPIAEEDKMNEEVTTTEVPTEQKVNEEVPQEITNEATVSEEQPSEIAQEPTVSEEQPQVSTPEPVTNEVSNNTKTYTVVKGDALVDISKKMYGTINKVQTITDANNIEDEDKIYIGQVLIIP